jgi:hypothetical protein
MVAGGDVIDDTDILRSGSTGVHPQPLKPFPRALPF